MYPTLTAPLLVLVAGSAVVLLGLAVTQPVLRRLAMRQVARRRAEAALVVAGSILGTAIIVGALVVGDTLGFSVRQGAYHTLGPIDERVSTSSPAVAGPVADRLRAGLERSPLVDGLLTARVSPAAAVHMSGRTRIAEPSVLVWAVDFASAARFGSAGGPSGLSGPTPGPRQLVVNAPFARALRVRPGDTVTLVLAGRPQPFVVTRVVPEYGIAGTGLGATRNRDAFVNPSLLSDSGHAASRAVTWVSNRGGVQSGDRLSSAVVRQIRAALGSLDRQVTIDTPKRDVLKGAKQTGDALGALFLMIGSFSIIAGALLLVNIFVMLAEERKPQLGMLRAAGLKRSRLVAAFTLEGAVYAVVATILGTGLGIAIGRGVALLAAKIFNSWSADGSGLDVRFAVSATSLVNGACLGLVIALATVAATSARISRFNIVAAIRELDVAQDPRLRRRRVTVATGLAASLAAAAVPAVVRSQGTGTFLLPSLAMLCLTPLLGQLIGKRAAYSFVASAVLGWTLLANVVRPAIYDTPSMAVYVVLGSLLAFSAVTLLSENQSLVLLPISRLLRRPTEGAVATRLALAYPVARRFRTGATLIMYALIVLVLVLLSEIGGVLRHSIDDQVASSTAGYGLRIDYNGALSGHDPVRALQSPLFADKVAAVAPLTSAAALATDPGRRTNEPIRALVVGVPTHATRAMQFQDRLPGLATDAAVWRAVANHPDYVVVDAFFGPTGGPAGQFYQPGDAFIITDPRTGRAERKTIVGILRNATVFYSALNPATFPAIVSDQAVRQQFGADATVSSAFVRTAPGVSVDRFATELQGRFLSASLVATPLASTIRRLFDANLAFFDLMEGFLALGLVIGISGLGVVMVRAVRERRRMIGILRALGFRSRTIHRAFLVESAFVAVEGVLLGSVLGVVTTWLMYQKSAAFNGIHTGFPVMWGTASVLALATVGASLLATLGPARRAARILPALATRTAA